MSDNKELRNNVEELSPPNTISATENSSIMASNSPSMDSGDKHSPLTSSKVGVSMNTELEASEEDLETIIEENLNPNKEKALDIDSELDFELKWDDDDVEINALNDDESIMTADEMTSDIKSDKAQILTVQKETVDKSFEHQINAELIHASDKDILDPTPLDEENILENASDDENVFKLESNVKLDLASKFMDNENSSLDERLVYSEELLDEIDAQISDTKKTFNHENSDVDASKTLVPVDQKEPNDDGIQSFQQEFISTEMDVDNKAFNKLEKVGLNDTCATIMDTETSSYEINMEHKLGKLDAMIEIPTQELIEGLDDSGELSEGVELYDEELLLENDAEPQIASIDSNKVMENTVNNDEKPEEPAVREVTHTESSPDVEDKSLVDVIKESNDTLDTNVTEKDIYLSSHDEEQKDTFEFPKSDDNIEIEDIEMTNEESCADKILEASHIDDIELDKLMEEKGSTNDLVSVDLKPKNSPLYFESEHTKEVDNMYSIVDTELREAVASALTKEITNIDDVVPKINAAEALRPNEVMETEETVTPNVLESSEDTRATDICSSDNSKPEAENVSNIVTKLTTEGEHVNSVVAPESTKTTETETTISTSILKASEEANKISSNADLDPNMVTESKTIMDGVDIRSVASAEPIEAKKVQDNLSSNILKPNENTDDKEISSLNNLEAKEDTEAKTVSSIDDLQIKQVIETKDVGYMDAQPSTSNLLQDLSDEDQVTDSLGLLAESSRVMDDDDEQEQEQEDDDDDNDDDFDQDDESNQMTAEHSEDSNAQHSETDAPLDSMDVEHSNNTDKEAFQCLIPEVASSETVEPDKPVAEDGTESMEMDTEVERAVQALISSNAAEDSMDQPAVASESGKSTSEYSSGVESDGGGKLRQLLTRDTDEIKRSSEEQSPSKTKKLEISKPRHEYNIVELEESSSEDDIQEVRKQADDSNVTCVNIPSTVEVMAAGAGHMSQMRQGERELLISVPKPPPHKPARLNTSEVTIKTAVTATEPLVIPDAAASNVNEKQSSQFGLEIFNLDSDDDEKDAETKKLEERESKCINVHCTSDSSVPRAGCDAAAAAYYGGARRGAVCAPCAAAVAARIQSLIEGVRDFTPLLSLDMGRVREELVEISDSESEEETEVVKNTEDAIGEVAAKFLEENLEDMLNATWRKYNMDSRLQEAQTQLDLDVRRLEAECKDIDAMLGECQAATDKLRRELYDSFAHERKELPAILIYDTPLNMWSGLEDGILAYEKQETRQSKRRLQATSEPPPKRAAIPLGYTPLDSDANKTKETREAKKAPASSIDCAALNDDDNADISVVKLSAEAAPAGLPPPGAPSRPPLRPQMPVYAMRNAFGAWLKAKIVDVQPKTAGQFTMCRVKFEHKVKNPCKLLPARCLAYDQPSDVRLTIGTRVIALFADTQSTAKSYYSGIIAEIPNPVNNYRYLVFFDDGYAQYVQHASTRLVCECAPLVWDEVHPFSRNFVRDYLRAYPERPMVRAHPGQSLKTEWNGKWWVSKVVQVDASLVQVHFEEDNRTEWIYRGSTRLAPLYLELQAAERHRARPLPRAAPGRQVNMPYVEYTRSDEPVPPAPAQLEDGRRQRAVAKKSTALPPAAAPQPLDGVSSRVVFYTPKNAIRPHKMVPHTCGARCRRSDVLALKDLRTYNPLTKPLLSGWERQIVKYRFTKAVMYRAPCGRRIRDYRELHRYLQSTGSDMGVDLFDFGPHTHCLAEFVLNKCLVSKKDLSHGKESVPVPCVNYYDSSLPEFCSYNTERTPTAGVPLNLDPEFLCGCDCTDDCADKMKCACWRMTLEGARTIGLDADVGYVYKRLPEPLPSGIYECNSRCKCRQTCLNRVAQHPLQLKLQVFKTLNRGWGIRALNDVPKGAFLCVYAGNLLTDATANLDGLNEGDEYLAELDYIEVVEQMKEGFEEDIPEADKKLDKEEEERSSPSSSSEEEQDPRGDDEDDDFRPAERLLRSAVPGYSKRLRKREKKKEKKEADNKEKKDKQKEKEGNSEDNCITISDDEELREPSRFEAQAGMGGKEFVSKYKSVRAHFGKDEACYIMDAKVQGNIGRYLNHSCTPNVFVQNVFVDTHDPRFPWVAFFALAHIRAGTELTWNYNYDVGSVPGKVLYCHCAAPNCRGRLL